MRKRTSQRVVRRRALLWGAALALAALGCQLGPWEAINPAVLLSPDPEGQIVVVGQDRNIYLADPSGGERRAVTEDAARIGEERDAIRSYGNPTWAPRTGHLAFTELTASSDGFTQGAVHFLRSGQERSEVVFEDPARAPFYLYWSPTGRSLSFLTSGGGEELDLWVVGETGPAERIDSGQPYYWTWAPEGGSILSHVGGSAAENPRGAGLRVLDPEGDERIELEHEPLTFQAPSFSPTGDRVLVAVDRPEEGGIVSLSPSGEYLSTLVRSERPLAFVWSPSGDRVAYLEGGASRVPAFGELAIIEVGGSDGAPALRPDLPPISGFFWSPTGEGVAALVPEIGAPGDDQQVSLTRQDQRLFMRLYLIEVDSGDVHLLTTFRPTVEFLEILPFFDQYAQSATIWSPTGTHLVYTSRQEGGPPAIFVMEAELGGEGRKVGEGALAFWSFEPAAD